MKLYLSSHMLGDHGDRLLAMTRGRGARMAIITNALDSIAVEAQIEYTRTRFDPVAYFAEHGFDPSPLDLRYYFGRPDALRAVLLRQSVVWAVGGNTFLLRRAMRESGFDTIVYDLLEEGLVYSGWSAGACVAGSDLQPIRLMDDPDVIAAGYPPYEPIRQGLGLVPFAIIPHYRSDHPEAASAEKAAAWAAEHGIEHRTLRDGEVIIVDGGEPTLLKSVD